MSTLTDERQSVYAHPLDHHTRTVALIHVAFGGGIEEVAGGLLLRFDSPPRPFRKAEDWQQAMCCDKIARRVATPDHDDSWNDEGGYVECRTNTVAERVRRRSLDALDPDSAPGGYDDRRDDLDESAPELPEDDWRQER